MVREAGAKLAPYGAQAKVAVAEDLPRFATDHFKRGGRPFDAALSNFAPLNCVEDLAPVARGLAALIRPGGDAMLVLFGCHPPGEMIIETLRGRPRQALRRLVSGPTPARIGAANFTIVYHRGRAVRNAMAPWFRLKRRIGVGVFVPPSAAEPWISRHPWLLGMLEALDRLVDRPLAGLGDHILYHFERTHIPAP
jgi:hypothetical protein